MGPATVTVADEKGNRFKFNEAGARAFLAMNPGATVVKGELPSTEPKSAPVLMEPAELMAIGSGKK